MKSTPTRIWISMLAALRALLPGADTAAARGSLTSRDGDLRLGLRCRF